MRRLSTYALCLTVLAVTSSAFGQGAEYKDESQGHQVGVSAAHRFRPNDPAYLLKYKAEAVAKIKAAHPNLDEGSAQFEVKLQQELKPIVDLADGLMQEMVCLCGGCGRETLHECKCGFAAEERSELLAILGNHDLRTKDGRRQAKADVVAKFIDKHGGEHVLGATRNPFAWLIPYLFAGGALVLLYAAGRRWVAKGRRAESGASDLPTDSEEDEDYADRLDDELRETE